MPPKTKQATATAEPLQAAPAVAAEIVPRAAPNDELAELDDMDFDENDGLAEASNEDMRVPARVFNFKGIDAASGRAIPPDEFFDTVDETVSREIDAAFVLLHKTNLYSRFNQADNRTERICRSNDRITGTMENGVVRPCEGCPDAEWHNIEIDGKIKRSRNCGPVYNMFAIDRNTHMPFVIRFRRTSLPIIKSYLQKHHLGRRIVKGKRMNYPLFAFRVNLKLKMDPTGKFALPVLTKLGTLDREELVEHASASKYLQDMRHKIIEATEEKAMDTEGGESGAPGDFASNDGQDFVEPTQPTDGDAPRTAATGSGVPF